MTAYDVGVTVATRYPATLPAPFVAFALIRSRRGATRQDTALELKPSNALWFLPVSIWGIEAVVHAHGWAFRTPYMGIAP